MELSRKTITSILLIILVSLSSLALYMYGDDFINRIMIIGQLIILIWLAFLNDIFSNKFIFLIIFLNGFSLIITMAYHNSFGVTIVFFVILISCFVFNNIQIDKFTYNIIHLSSTLIWSGMVFLSKEGSFSTGGLDPNKYKFLNSTYHKNTMGIVSLGCLYHWLCIIDTIPCRKSIKNILSIIVGIPYFIMIINSECRSSFFALVIFIFIYVFVNKELTYRTFYVLLIVGIVISGLFSVFYVNNIEWLDLGDVMGRSTFNRLDTWKAAFSLIKKYPFFGSGTDFKMVYYDSAHNTMLSLFKTIGIIPTVSYIICFGYRFQEKRNLSYCKICQIILLSSLIISIFESFYSESYFSIVFLSFLINFKQCRSEIADSSNYTT